MNKMARDCSGIFPERPGLMFYSFFSVGKLGLLYMLVFGNL